MRGRVYKSFALNREVVTFIRLKVIAGKQYAYLVENSWSAKGPRQKVSRYLGKYIELPATPVIPAEANTSSIITAELRSRGFSEKLTFGKIKVSLQTCTVREGRKKIVLGLNGAFLCDYTLRKLLHFHPSVEVTPGYGLARAFSDAGVRVTREQFVVIYKKLYKKAETRDADARPPAQSA
jgi:hypothetical protein